MKQYFETHLWPRRALSAVLSLALLAALLLPLFGRTAAEPENPILTAHAQDITVLESGGGTQDAAGDGTDGQTEYDQTAAPEDGSEEATDEDPDPQTPEEPETAEQPQPTQQPDTAPESGDALAQEGEAEEQPDPEALDVSAVLTWYKYGKNAATVVCQDGRRVGRRILTAQLPDGRLRYDVSLTGLDAENAEITDVRFAAENARARAVDTRGTQTLTLPEAAETRSYVFTVEAEARQKTADGWVTQTLDFAFVLHIENDLDLDLRLTWDTDTGTDYALCAANAAASATVRGEQLTENTFRYQLAFAGDAADDAELLSCEYWPAGAAAQTISDSGELVLHAAENSDRQTYYISARAQVAQDDTVQTVQYTFTITYIEQPYDLQLQFTWYSPNREAHDVTCQPQARTALTLYSNQLSGGNLDYRLTLTGRDSDNAEIVSAACDETSIDKSSGTLRLTAEDGAGEYTVAVTAKLKDRDEPIQYTLTLRYSSDVRVYLDYAIQTDGVRQTVTASCENKKDVRTAEVYTNQLTDDTLSYTLRTDPNADTPLTITGVKFTAPGANPRNADFPGGSVVLATLNGAAAENTLDVTAADAAGNSYTFTFRIPYKPIGDGKVEFDVRGVDSSTPVTNGAEVTLSVRVWSVDAEGNYLTEIDGRENTELRIEVTDDTGTPDVLQRASQSGRFQEYKLLPNKAARGDTNTHTLRIEAEDEYGNKGTYELTFPGLNTEAGQPIGTATIRIDLTALGLGVVDSMQYTVLAEEPISMSIAKAIWGEDVGEPFGKLDDPLWPGGTHSYSGSLDQNFYLEMLDDGSNLGARAKTLNISTWTELGSTEEEQLAAIDAHFGADTGLAALWRCLRRNNVEPTGGSSDGRLREYDFTMGSGWLYCLNNDYYPGESMSSRCLQDGDVLTLRFTLAYGWDVGSGQDGYGSSAGYCVRAVNGTIEVDHEFEQTGEDGAVQYVCRHCGLVQDCPHEQTEFRSLDDRQHEEVCLVCGEAVRTEAHDTTQHPLQCTPLDDTQHTAECTVCGWKAEQAHDWQLAEEQEATCTEAGFLRQECAACGHEITETIPAAGHDFSADYAYDEQAHWNICSICGARDETSYAAHTDGWAGDSREHWHVCELCGYDSGGSREAHTYDESWTCTGCGYTHDELCGGTPARDSADSDCTQEVWRCDSCKYAITISGDFHEYESGFCIHCGRPDPDYVDPGDGEDEDASE